MSNLSLKNKLLLLAILPLTLLLISLMASSYYLEYQNQQQNFVSFKTKLIADKESLLATEVEIGRQIINYELAKGTKEDAKNALRDLTFGKDGYFFIYDTKGVSIFHALLGDAIEGQNKIAMTDPNGKKIIVGLLEQARQGGGAFYYDFQKPNTTGLVEKMGYAAMVPGTDWMLGTGAYMDDIEAELTKYQATIQAHMNEKVTTLLLIALFWVMLTVFFALIAANNMVKPIQNMVQNLDDIAKGEGDLTKRLEVHSNDEIGQLGNSFNVFVSKLHSIITNVADVTRDVKDSSNDINTQTQLIENQLVNHNHETELVATAITEMSATSQEVAQNTTQVAVSTQSATQDVANAQKCVDVSLEEVSNLMSEINQAAEQVNSLSEQSKKINSVLSVIGGIAEQTNLLALNAAIEAARAGEQGRGFAVVADEVRSLASRTQESTLEINEMLNELHTLVTAAVKAMLASQQSCNRSVESSRAISESLGAVTSSVTTINDMSTQIATAATEQSSVTEEINRNVFAIQEIVNELTRSIKTTSSVSHHLAGRGESLGNLVGQFKI
ncbi:MULTISPECIES: methyl-accepting chemotaxis protein [Pseudoalteromonas]|jgi:methyl-accepting chemotaxis protein|uniref:methyl-accepting chemotaxis protein n=1 Tax=Pseudoalteromonas TaxID=53246 RepID=UPI00160439E6|nr:MULTISPECIES: methyl-accepting chemotaxis protein [Pseudoalteromonas]MBB1292590.1 cache domain-containing protein [Pseudoalteromonas sp. SR41-4]MBB1300775.1 cache domain-containing protein [Pseudoalteromonas sp. SR44-8]MBB1308892.1 cache domain-containing protein [Pseudoalteromonas sp. SR41-8]MBB1399645.1 cache domain-containing protein [Pseudoalteromonas sp. SG44-8]MBB1408194.1 cache domain-containing protein [Pseudoalteromonas sp. SG44-17]